MLRCWRVAPPSLLNWGLGALPTSRRRLLRVGRAPQFKGVCCPRAESVSLDAGLGQSLFPAAACAARSIEGLLVCRESYLRRSPLRPAAAAEFDKSKFCERLQIFPRFPKRGPSRACTTQAVFSSDCTCRCPPRPFGGQVPTARSLAINRRLRVTCPGPIDQRI